MDVFVNRTINMKKIKAIGFDMDYTIVRYNTKEFEGLAHRETLKKLVSVMGYPEEILKLEFDYQRSIQGLVIDKKRGNLLKISRYGKVKVAFHGLESMNFNQMQEIYRNRVVDLSDPQFQSLDTSFSISNGILFSQLVQLKKEGLNLPDYFVMADEIKEGIDIAHGDGSLKEKVKLDIKKYVIIDPEVSSFLENLKSYGKKLLVITNSDYAYSKLLLDNAITPFLKNHKCWSELFDLTITLSRKPNFFTQSSGFLTIDPASGKMTNSQGPITKGIYQGGWAGKLQDDLGLEGDEILYLGDHIYGDVVSIKKTFNWRTALVLDPLEEEIQALKSVAPIQDQIDKLMEEKEEFEKKVTELESMKFVDKEKLDRDEVNKAYAQIDKINNSIGVAIEEYRKFFNPYWGEMMRAGQEESRFADQVEKYACLYMTKITDLASYNPRTYFRPRRRTLPHECW